MSSIIKILYKTKETFDYLDDQHENQLDKICNRIFLLLGIFSGLTSLFKEFEPLKGLYGNTGIIIMVILSILIGGGIGILIGSYVLPYLIIWIGRLLKVSREIIDIRVVVAYSMIPTFLKILTIIFLEVNNKFETLSRIEYLIINCFSLLIWVWVMKIVIQGLMKFYNYGLFKGIINVSFFIIPPLIGYLLIFSKLIF